MACALDQLVTDGNGRCGATIGHTKLAEQTGNMALNRAVSNEERLRYLGIRSPLTQQAQDFLLPSGQVAVCLNGQCWDDGVPLRGV